MAVFVALAACVFVPAAEAQRGGRAGSFHAQRQAQGYRAPSQAATRNAAPQRGMAIAPHSEPSRASNAFAREGESAPVYRGAPATGAPAMGGAAQSNVRPALTGPQISAQPARPAGIPQSGANAGGYPQRSVNGGPPIQRGAPQAGPQQHLGQWMQQHQNQSTQQQQQALKNEPGFNRLPSEQQQRLQQRLQQLNRMPEQDRQRTLGYVEGMERLTPQQRGQVNSALGQMHTLPQDQQRQVGRAFNQIRRLPPAQRGAAAQGYAGQMNPQQQQTLNNLMRAEPYLPLQR